MAELGFSDVAALRAHLETAPDNHVTDPADLVTLAEELIERAEAEAPALVRASAQGHLRGPAGRATPWSRKRRRPST